MKPTQAISTQVTPSMAADWLLKHPYKGQRKVRNYHVQNLARMMQEGFFTPNTQIAFAQLGQELFLVNGQHTLNAIVFSDVTTPLSIVIHECRTETQVADLFARYDTHLTRQFSDSLTAHRLDEELGVTRNDLNTIAAASMYYAACIGGESFKSLSQLTQDQKMNYMRQYGLLAKSALELFVGASNKSYFTRKTTMASAMFCLKEPYLASEFFTAVAKDDGLHIGDPRKTLLEWLRSHTTPGGRHHSYSVSKVAADHEMIKAISLAWNAWTENRDLKVIRVNFDAVYADFNRVGKLQVKGNSSKKPIRTS